MLAHVLAVIMCLCVCLSVTHRYCIRTAKRRITQTTPRDSPGTLVFWRQNSLMNDPFPLKFALKVTPSFQTQFRPTSTHSTSTVRGGEKSSVSTNRKSTTRFPVSHRWTIYVTFKSPICLKFELKVTHPLRRCRFRQISLNSAAAMRASKKSSVIAYRKLTLRLIVSVKFE